MSSFCCLFGIVIISEVRVCCLLQNFILAFYHFFFFFSWHPAAAASGDLVPPKRFGLLKFPCVLFWPMWPAWKARRGGGWVNVSYARLLMRPETKERADTIISALRASFTFYQATAGDMGMWGGAGGDRGAEPEEWRGSRQQKKQKREKAKKCLGFQCANISHKWKLSHRLRWRFSGRSLGRLSSGWNRTSQ